MHLKKYFLFKRVQDSRKEKKSATSGASHYLESLHSCMREVVLRYTLSLSQGGAH